MAHLAAIRIYPLKSFSPQAVRAARVLASGALADDRRFALRDAAGRFWNGKRTAVVHRWRTWLQLDHRVLTLRERDGGERAWQLDHDRPQLERFFAEAFAGDVALCERAEGGFPDDTDAPGPTVVSTATLEEVASWFPGLTLEDVRDRFRANLEIAGVPAFWEDRLYRADGAWRPFRIGAVTWGGVNPCQRCAVPTRDALTGEGWPGFQQVFTERRSAALPEWAPRERFNHCYRLAVNTRLVEGAGASVQVGDAVELLEAV